LPKGITGKVQRTRLNGLLSKEPPTRDAEPRGAPLRFWGRLKQLATFAIPRRHPVVEAPLAPLGAITSESPASSDGDLHADLLQVWKRLLKVETLSIDDDFFEKGGNSLLVMDLHIEIERLTAKPLPESFLSGASTIRALVKALSA